MIEKRRFSRVQFKKELEIISNGDKFQGEIENLSLKGAFIKTPRQLKIEDPVELVIHLAGDASFDINLKGKVVRVTPEGSGILFEKIDLDSFAHLRNIIAYNFGDDDKVMEEFFNYLNDQNTVR